MLSFLFKKREKEDSSIQKFQDEHQDLLNSFNNILELANSSKFQELEVKISNFIDIFMEHIKKEADEIYEFLERNLDPHKDYLLLNEIQTIKKDMVPIRKKVNILTLKYRSLNKDNIKNFIDDFSYLGGVLIKRIDIEENKLFKYYSKKKKR